MSENEEAPVASWGEAKIRHRRLSMSHSNYGTNQDSVQPPRANIEHAQTQHWDELSKVALYLYHLLSNRMKPPPALPAGCLWDEYLGQCLLSHLRAEFNDVPWPESWDDLAVEQITGSMLAKLQQVARSRIFVGTCAICEGGQQHAGTQQRLLPIFWNHAPRARLRGL